MNGTQCPCADPRGAEEAAIDGKPYLTEAFLQLMVRQNSFTVRADQSPSIAR
jgi:hypothetical protein